MTCAPTTDDCETVRLECLTLVGSVGSLGALDDRLREIMQSRDKYHEIILVAYLRNSWTHSRDLLSWQPLMNTTIEIIRQRGVYQAESLLSGLMPQQSFTTKNTPYTS